jgi:hypothetical protein
MGKKFLVALTMEGKFAGQGLQSIDEDDDMLSAMARELVERNGISETADAVWRALNSSTENIRSRFQRLPDAQMMARRSKYRILSLTLRILLQKPWTARPWSSSDSEQPH